VPEIPGEEDILGHIRLTRDDILAHQPSLMHKMTRAEQMARI